MKLPEYHWTRMVQMDSPTMQKHPTRRSAAIKCTNKCVMIDFTRRRRTMRTRVVTLAILEATNIGIKTLTFAKLRWSKVGGGPTSGAEGTEEKEEEDSSRSVAAPVKDISGGSVDMAKKAENRRKQEHKKLWEKASEARDKLLAEWLVCPSLRANEVKRKKMQFLWERKAKNSKRNWLFKILA